MELVVEECIVAVGKGIAFGFDLEEDHLYRLGYRRVEGGLVLDRVGSLRRGGICTPN